MLAALVKQWPPSRGLLHAWRGVSCAPVKQFAVGVLSFFGWSILLVIDGGGEAA